jgi:hypothetical protein
MKRILMCGVALAALSAVPAMADAVDGVNGKVSAGAGSYLSSSLYYADGSLDVPLGDDFGLQVDGIVGKIHDFTFYGGGAHLFWRDPNTALLGLYGSIVHINLPFIFSVDIEHLGGEVEWYASDNVTLSGTVGGERLAINPFGHTTRWFDKADITFYPSDNFSVGVGHRYTLGSHAAVLNAAYQFEGSGISLFAQARAGENHNSGLFGGLTYAFGGDKTLKERSREDDPADTLVEDLGGGGGDLGSFGGGEGSD